MDIPHEGKGGERDGGGGRAGGRWPLEVPARGRPREEGRARETRWKLRDKKERRKERQETHDDAGNLVEWMDDVGKKIAPSSYRTAIPDVSKRARKSRADPRYNGTGCSKERAERQREIGADYTYDRKADFWRQR